MSLLNKTSPREATQPRPWRRATGRNLAAGLLIGVAIIGASLLKTSNGQNINPECTRYDPSTAVVRVSDGRYRVEASGVELARFAREEDAARALSIVRQFNQHCILEPLRLGHGGMEFWQGPSAESSASQADTDCMSFSPIKLRVEPDRSGKWMVTSGMALLLTAQSRGVAEQAMRIASRYSRLCAVGRTQVADSPDRWVMIYWR